VVLEFLYTRSLNTLDLVCMNHEIRFPLKLSKYQFLSVSDNWKFSLKCINNLTEILKEKKTKNAQ